MEKNITGDLEKDVVGYLNKNKKVLPAPLKNKAFTVSYLARGEYNLNFLINSNGAKFVLRVNIGTQINRDDQILYEYNALKLLEKSGCTPKAYYADHSKKDLDYGLLIMEYLPGEALDYKTDVDAAAGVFARIHQIEVEEADNHLIREESPLSIIYEECAGLLTAYFNSDLADPAVASYLREVSAWADEHRKYERYFLEDPVNCIVNTEVNSGNFIVNRKTGSIHLVDWEMPRWGDPTNDLAHFCSPFTTLWKTDYRMTPGVKKAFLDKYISLIKNKKLSETIHDRMRLKEPFVLLRGISWSAMGHIAYQSKTDEYSGMKNESTRQTLQKYMNLDFIRSVFDEVI